MTKKLLILLGCLCLLALLAPASASALAPTTRTLTAGRTYEFTGLDSRLISHVTVTGTARYDHVTINSRGVVTAFGTSSGRFSVHGTGRVVITPQSNMTIGFDTSRVTMREIEGRALRLATVAMGSTVHLQNDAPTSLHIRTNQAAHYDAAVFDRLGRNTFVGRDIRFPQFSVPAGGSAMVTAYDGDLELIFPAFWYGDYITISNVNHPALLQIELFAGQVYVLSNRSDNMNYSIPVYTLYEGDTFTYDYVLRLRDGHVDRSNTVSNNRIMLNNGMTITITPLIDADIVIPYIWLTDLRISYGVETEIYRVLPAGQSLAFSNTYSRAQSIIINNVDDEVFSLKYVIYRNDEVEFAVLSELTGTRTLSVPAGATLTLTATGIDVNVFVPDVDTLNVQASQPALLYYELAPNASVLIENNWEDRAEILAVTEEENNYDFLLFFGYEDMIGDFGRGTVPASGRQTVFVSGGDWMRVTNTGEHPIRLYYPRMWHNNGLGLASTNTAALFRQVIQSGEAVHVINQDRDYEHSFVLQNESDRRNITGRPNMAYEYLVTGLRDVVITYGESTQPSFSIPSGARAAIAPLTGHTISVMFPTEWYGQYLRVVSVNEMPLHRVTLRPGERVTIRNSSRYEFTLSNNSGTTAAAYFLRRPGQNVRIQANEEPSTGPITVPRGSNITIIAATGADLEIFMPRAWTRHIRIS